MTGPELEGLHGWIVKRNSDESLKRLADYKLGVRLDEIAGPGNLNERVDALIQWAREKERLDDLIRVVGYTPPQRRARLWPLAVEYPLQPAPHFAGREALLAELSAWAADPITSVRVVSLVAVGGTGKTALAERVLSCLPNENPFGVLVWSFYKKPQTEALLRAACEYFLGEAPKETGGLIERLQHGLRDDSRPHLLILDGLELIQATGRADRPRGALEDPLMKRFLRWLAAGRGTRTKMLITSRFPLLDLEDWRDQGFRSIDLEDLDAAAGRFVLRRRGVKGTDAELDALTESVRGHALTVDVLGLYLQRFGNGDPQNAAKFDLKAFGKQQKAERLGKVLTSYAEQLPDDERDLLARLSLFPRGVTVEHLAFVIGAGGEIAGALVACDQVRLLNMLEGLRELGLVFVSVSREGRTYSAHPFLRDFFRTLLGATKPEQVHEAVRSKLAPGLEGRPGTNPPTDPADLDRYERLIEATRLAGDTREALRLYCAELGRYKNLGWVVGDDARGLRILSAFSSDGTPATAGLTLSASERAVLVGDWGMHARNAGDLTTARSAIGLQNVLRRGESDLEDLPYGFQILADVELLAGRWLAAREAGAISLIHAEAANRGTRLGQALANAHATLGAALGCSGALSQARAHFTDVSVVEQKMSVRAPLRGVWEAEFKLAAGNRAGALAQTKATNMLCRRENFTRVLALCDTVLGRCALPDDPFRARDHLAGAREYASRTGNIEVTLRCYHLAAEIERCELHFSLAESEALDGIQLADSCGFGRWSLDIRTELARIYLAADESAKAVEPAERVLKRSEEPDCQYAWGIADSLHFLGVAHARLGDKQKARDYLERAIWKRKLLEHPELSHSEDELAELFGRDTPAPAYE